MQRFQKGFAPYKSVHKARNVHSLMSWTTGNWMPEWKWQQLGVYKRLCQQCCQLYILENTAGKFRPTRTKQLHIVDTKQKHYHTTTTKLIPNIKTNLQICVNVSNAPISISSTAIIFQSFFVNFHRVSMFVQSSEKNSLSKLY